MDRLFLGAFALALGVWSGNYSGDQATLRDCATKGQARMTGGGEVKCEVVRTQPQPEAKGLK